ncbi:DUF6456 domain-containing protein [Ochrobactrum sp. Marseille-Q0166]|uniref:DUF6456 domain-containing protein n=1 Tax=Ochrobactrum sp. Marseille-Q0166 TaxID=2761105 RepID=UPI001655BB70|nr:DUF6456 domain-containing protein [Ochrobactrum sp. Marseille-Q0166]MBC8717858.1 hypothetical protein [Ochrobactrum sp. Marseille-Q0166]
MREGRSTSELRIIRFLKYGSCEVQDSVRDTHVLLVGEQGSIAVTRAEIDEMQRIGVLVCENQSLALANQGKKRRRTLSQSKNLHPKTETLELPHGEKIEINPSESPLAKLYRLRNSDGESFITEDEFRAGERLRSDFTRGSMMPSISARWDVPAGNSGHYGACGMAELTDIALASRIRVERALEAVGPELSGVLIDVCCFLKGLELVERERQWPVRSGKMLLKTALAMLHRHFNPPRRSESGVSPVLHWGTGDYRPAAHPGRN